MFHSRLEMDNMHLKSTWWKKKKREKKGKNTGESIHTHEISLKLNKRFKWTAWISDEEMQAYQPFSDSDENHSCCGLKYNEPYFHFALFTPYIVQFLAFK